MIVQNLKMLRSCNMTLAMVKEALRKATRVVFVCETQRRFYGLFSLFQVIYVGVPPPVIDVKGYSEPNSLLPFTFLSIGIVCPRKNQIWAVELFKKFAVGKTNVRLVIVGARYIRQYEMDYIQTLKEFIGKDTSISLHEVTENVDAYYQDADVLLFTSTNEVTPMVIVEAMSYGIPVITTNIAGIPEMLDHGIEGFLVDPGNSVEAVEYMALLHLDADLRAEMGRAGRRRFETYFDIDIIVERYRRVFLWSVGGESRDEPRLLVHTAGFYENLLPVRGALKALAEMESEGFRVYLVTSPTLTPFNFVQEKVNWVRRHLGEHWVDKLVFCSDKVAHMYFMSFPLK